MYSERVAFYQLGPDLCRIWAGFFSVPQFFFYTNKIEVALLCKQKTDEIVHE